MTIGYIKMLASFYLVYTTLYPISVCALVHTFLAFSPLLMCGIKFALLILFL
jgi:hypothetical protein